MAVCSLCSVELPPENDFITCSGCGGELHYSCANVRETVWRNYNAKTKLAWKCTICKAKTTSADNVKPQERVNKTENKTEFKDDCTGFSEVEYLKELLRHKDMIISNQADLIVSLKDQIGMMRTHRMHGPVVSRNKAAATLQMVDSRRPAPPEVVVSSKAEMSPSARFVGDKLPGGGEHTVSESLPKQGSLVDIAPVSISSYDVLEALTHTKLDHYINLPGKPDASSQAGKTRTRRPRQTIIGNRSLDDKIGLRAAESYSYWHVYRLHPDTKKEDVEAYLQAEFRGVQVEKMDSSNPTQYSSFKIMVKESDGKRILDPDLWPSGARINRFFLPRRK